ncbi:hypothetical protein RB653_009708 [Dictyostelium firmibasis]|uniref:Uncharacterized protein n=1 Tax=Dictyostelium firmibasis TaxID=79012 RepID=A0AAN7TSU4_9MYCE
MKILNISFLILVILFIAPLIFSQDSTAPHYFFGSLVITRKELSNNQLRALVLNLNSGTLINSDHKRFQVPKDTLQKVVDLLKKLDINGGTLDLRNSSVPAKYEFFMANTQFGKSIIWQDGTESGNEILLEVEGYFNSFASQKNAEKIFNGYDLKNE